MGSPQTETTSAGFPTCHDGDRCSSELSVAKIKLEYPNTWPFFLLKNLAHPKCRGKISLKVFLDIFGLSEFKSELFFVQKKFIVEISNLMTLIVCNCRQGRRRRRVTRGRITQGHRVTNGQGGCNPVKDLV